MRVYNLVFALILALVFISCDNESQQSQPIDYTVGNPSLTRVDIEGYENDKFSEGIYQSMFLINNVFNNGNYKFEFKEGKVVKRIGGYSDPDFISNFYDTIFKNGNKITIFKKLIPFGSISATVPYKNVFCVNDQNEIKYKIEYKLDFTDNDNDTIYFEYLNNKISRTWSKNYLGYKSKESKFYFNADKNLDSIVTRRYVYDHITGQMYLHPEKEKEFFEQYDNAPNPFKSLTIFDDMFKRSLSKNNFKRHEIRIYNTLYIDSYNVRYRKQISTSYDSQGNLIYKN